MGYLWPKNVVYGRKVLVMAVGMFVMAEGCWGVGHGRRVLGCWSWPKGVVYGQKVLVIADGCWQARIQDSEGGVSYIQKGGGGFVQDFQERIQIVAGPWANQQAKKIADSRRGGGGSDHPKKKPVSTHGWGMWFMAEGCWGVGHG